MATRVYFFTLAGILFIGSFVLSLKSYNDCQNIQQILNHQQNMIFQLNESLKIHSLFINKVEQVNEKQQLDINEISLQMAKSEQQNVRLTNLELFQKSETIKYSKQINEIISKIKVINTIVAGIQKDSDQINNIIIQQGILTNNVTRLSTEVNQNNFSEKISQLEKELGIMKFQLSQPNQEWIAQFSTIKSNFTTLSNEIQKLTGLSQDVNSLNVDIDSLKKQVPDLNKTVSALNLKINSETFNKVDIKGPYYARHHSNQINLRKSEYKIFETTEPCILNINGKAVVKLTAMGISFCSNCEVQLTFLKNRKVFQNEISSDFLNGNYAYNQFTIVLNNQWEGLTFSQEYIMENEQNCEITIGIKQLQGSDNILIFNGLSFVVKISYIF